MSKVRAALYVRVSTLEQAQSGYSVGEQKDRLTKYAAAQDYSVVKVYSDEGVSGKSLVRPQMEKLLSDIEAGKIDTVLIYKLDRLSRHVKDVLELVELFEKYGVTLFSLHENIDLSSPFGRASLKMSATFSELERETIVERMEMGKAARAKSGKYSCPGKCPFGYRLDKDNDCFSVNEREAEAIRDAFAKYVYEGFSFRRLFSYCRSIYSDLSFFSHPMSCKAIIKRPLYAGYFLFKGELIKAVNVPSIIPYELYLQAQEAVKRNTSRRDHDNSPYLLTGLVVCARCGRAYVGKLYDRNKFKGDGTKTERYRYTSYGCRARVKRDSATDSFKCDNDIFPTELLDDYVERSVMNLRFDDFVAPVVDTGVIDRLTLENEELEKQRDRLLDAFLIGIINKETLARRTEELNKKMKRNTMLIESEHTRISSAPSVSIENLKKRQRDYKSLDKKQKRELLRLLIKNIVIDGKSIVINWYVK